MQLEKGKVYRIKDTASSHGGKLGRFAFYGTGPSEGIAVFDDIRNSSTFQSLFAVKVAYVEDHVGENSCPSTINKSL